MNGNYFSDYYNYNGVLLLNISIIRSNGFLYYFPVAVLWIASNKSYVKNSWYAYATFIPIGVPGSTNAY